MPNELPPGPPGPAAGSIERFDERLRVWLLALRELWGSAGMSMNHFARLHQPLINKGTVSRYLSGERVPGSTWFLEQLLDASQKKTGQTITGETRDHLNRLQLDALEARHPHEYKIRLAQDELRGAMAESRAFEDKVRDLEEKIADLTEELERANARNEQLRIDQVAEQAQLSAVEALAAGLRRKIEELMVDLRDAEQRRDHAQSRTKELEDLLDRLDATSPDEHGDDLPLRETSQPAVAGHELKIPFGEPFRVSQIIKMLQEIGLDGYAGAVAGRVATEVEVEDPLGVASLLKELRELGAPTQAGALAGRATTRVKVTNTYGVAYLLEQLRALEADALAETLAERAVPEVKVTDPRDIAKLLAPLDKPSTRPLAYKLIARAVRRVKVTDPGEVASLMKALRAVEAPAWAQALAERAIPEVEVSDTPGVTDLLKQLRGLGADALVKALAERAAPKVQVHDPDDLQRFLIQLRELGRHDLADDLIERTVQSEDPDSPSNTIGPPDPD